MSRTKKDFPCEPVLEAHTAQPGILDNGRHTGLTGGVVAAAGTGAACLSAPSASYHHTLSMSWIMTAHHTARRLTPGEEEPCIAKRCECDRNQVGGPRST